MVGPPRQPGRGFVDGERLGGLEIEDESVWRVDRRISSFEG